MAESASSSSFAKLFLFASNPATDFSNKASNAFSKSASDCAVKRSVLLAFRLLVIPLSRNEVELFVYTRRVGYLSSAGNEETRTAPRASFRIFVLYFLIAPPVSQFLRKLSWIECGAVSLLRLKAKF